MQEDDKKEQPGFVYSPAGQSLPEPQGAAPVQPAQQPLAQANPTPVTPQPVEQYEQPQPAQQQTQPAQPAPITPPEDSGFYTPSLDSSAPASSGGVSWTASEYLANPKNAGWFMLLGLLTIVVCAVVYLITKDVVSTVVIAILGVIVGVFAARQPHVLTYRIDNRGIQIGQKYYSYAAFKAFSIAEEHAMGYISLLPLKRFMTPIIIHYSPDDEENIVNTLADYLPYEDHKIDVIENISRRVRF